MYKTVTTDLLDKFSYHSDKNEWYAVNKNNVAVFVGAKNAFTLRVECFVWMYDNRYMAVIKSLAENLHSTLEPERELITPPEMIKRPEGKDFGMQDYVD